MINRTTPALVAAPKLAGSWLAILLAACPGDEPTSVQIARIELTPTADTVVVEDTVRIRATARDAAGKPLTNQSIAWRSSDTQVAHVDDNGLVRGLSRGSATITAQAGGVAASAQVLVRDPYVRIAINRRLPSLFPADTTLLIVVAFDSIGQRVDLREATWTSSNLAVALVSRAGVVSSQAVGRATLRARVGQSTDSVEVVVVPKRVGANREIAFVRDTSNGPTLNELWLTTTDSSTARRISAPGRYLHSFAWSPDGSLLAIAYFVTQAGEEPLFELVDPQAGTRRSLPMFVGDPDVAPDNQRIAFTHFTGTDLTVATMALDGTDLRLYDNLAGRELVPRWSPDGRQLAFLLNPSAGIFQVWVMRADGTAPRQLSPGSFARNPAWSPDGKYLAFDDQIHIWIADPETGALRNLTAAGIAGFPGWAADGSKIVYGSGGALRVVRPDGSQISEVPTGGQYGEMGSISPDGSKLAVTLVVGSAWKIVVMDLDGSRPSTVTGYNSWLPAWRPAALGSSLVRP
jgi:Tol biopolymer transport system component